MYQELIPEYLDAVRTVSEGNCASLTNELPLPVVYLGHCIVNFQVIFLHGEYVSFLIFVF